MENTLTDTPRDAAQPPTSDKSGQAPRASLIAAGLAGLGASACCIVPFALMAAGIGGAWMSAFTALEPYRPIFIGVTAIFLAAAFYKLYFVPRQCESNGECVDRVALRRHRTILWSVTVLLVPVVTFPYYFGYLM